MGMGFDAGSDQTILSGLCVAIRSLLELDAKTGEQAQGLVEHRSDFTAHTRHIKKRVAQAASGDPRLPPRQIAPTPELTG